MYAVGYVRQSKERKDRESISPETQIEKIKQFAKLQETKVVKIFRDIDISGFRVHYSKRTGLMDMLEYIKANNIKKVYVYNLARLSRRIKDFLEITNELEKYGCSVVSATEMIDMSTPQGRLFRNIMLSFNEYYSDSLSATIHDNHMKNVELKKWNGGHAPFGFSWNKADQKFEKNKDYETLLLIREKAVNMWGVKKISNHLNRRNILSPNGGKWTSQAVKYILLNPFYRGYLQYDGKLYESPLAPKVFSPEDWEKIQENLNRYVNLGPRGKATPHLLTGLLVCGACNSRMEIRYNGSNRVRRYICSNRQNGFVDKCSSSLLDADGIEQAVIKHIKSLTITRYIDQIIEEAQKISRPKANDLKSEIRHLERELEKVIQGQKELYEETFIRKNVTKERFYEMNRIFEEERQRLEEEIKELYKQMNAVDITYIFDYKEELENFSTVFDALSKEEQRTAIHSLVDKIVVHDECATIHLPVGKTKIKSTSNKRGTLYFM
ncbi:Resolvase domain containing protein [Caldalkalibacillus thermarum TA2.A1]|uniref:Recombinase family protein n=1 Tax=Caldalkalibacillus thermarum (strain TA2.A1) TaxID=986075 RepID=F5L6L9_CALTT|nr:recombinase family protein [Caldalkalibacillus thermarum]EGL83026.1 Resolvase domain containing protein [Caldalkalibacillus thermarum TA2.A1]QZT33726.1 recombinase family protein [Caldalkalibacillus thermarum TA2.A1]